MRVEHRLEIFEDLLERLAGTREHGIGQYLGELGVVAAETDDHGIRVGPDLVPLRIVGEQPVRLLGLGRQEDLALALPPPRSTPSTFTLGLASWTCCIACAPAA
ncbi:hypothetical protein ACWEKM_21600 [Streptomyces sp. NPDC004752]